MPIRQVPDEIAEFISAVDEIRVVDDFAKNEGIFLGRHITLISVTLNGVTRRSKHFGIGVHTNGHLHKFRDSAATRSLRAGIDVRTVQARL